jgi:hypothetical protein
MLCPAAAGRPFSGASTLWTRLWCSAPTSTGSRRRCPREGREEGVVLFLTKMVERHVGQSTMRSLMGTQLGMTGGPAARENKTKRSGEGLRREGALRQTRMTVMRARMHQNVGTVVAVLLF